MYNSISDKIKSQSMIIRLAIGPLIFVSLLRFKLKETRISDAVVCGFSSGSLSVSEKFY